MKITVALKKEIETDIKLCNEHTERNGSMPLYNDLVTKYVVIDPDFEKAYEGMLAQLRAVNADKEFWLC